MCGIAGVMSPTATEATVTRQLGLLHHRGPDSLGVYAEDGIAVGQSRLAVIDLLTGDPPISGEANQVVVTFNGEIYNFRELRAELCRKGHTFATQGDTEVIAHLAEEYDPTEVCRQLDGMFAIAVWDSRTNELWLARDKVGKKPIYYWHSSAGDVVFGSEIKALLAEPRVPRQLASGAIDAYLTFGYVPTPRTFFEGIFSVPPGHVIAFRQGQVPRITRYWQFPGTGVRKSEVLPVSFEDAAQEVRELLQNAVAKRLVSDVPLGAFLSGGVDSSAVVAIMARMSGDAVRTFTIGFDDAEGFDERAYARQLASMYRTTHTEFVVDANKVDLVERLVWHHDQPFGDSSALPLYLLSELTRHHVTVALCGDGGDEIFAGYDRLAAAAIVQRLGLISSPVMRLSRLARRLPASVLGSRAVRAQRALQHAGEGNPRALLSWTSYISDEWRQRLLPEGSHWGIDDYERIWDEGRDLDGINRLLYLNFHTYLLDDLLPKTDRMSMAHGLEVRSPFLDNELVEFAFRLPGPYKIKGWSKKRVLKRAVSDILPPELLYRPKRGFGIPLDRWFRTELRSFTKSVLGGSSARISEHLSGVSVGQLLAEHMSGRRCHGQALWALLTLEIFLRQEGW